MLAMKVREESRDYCKETLPERGTKKAGYAIGVADSEFGLVTGPWKQKDELLVDIGGHGMLFDDFCSKEHLALQSTNTDRMERTHLICFAK